MERDVVLLVLGCVLLPGVTATVLWLLGRCAMSVWRRLFPPAIHFDPAAAPPALLPPGWGQLVLVASIASVPAWVVHAPSSAQVTLAWAKLWGYPATVLSVPLQEGNAAQRDAVLALLEPLRTLGSRRVGDGAQDPGEDLTDTVVPVHYRVEDKYLEVALARTFQPAALEHFVQLLHSLQTPDAPTEWTQVAAWHCRLQESWPLRTGVSRTRQLQIMQRNIDLCQGPRTAALATAAPLVAGQLGDLQSTPQRHFSPWWSGAGWQVWTPVPAGPVVQP